VDEPEIYSDGIFDAYIVGSKSNRVFSLDRDRCKGCAICVKVCPYDAIVMSSKKTHMGYFHPIENGKCTACRECVLACPDFALSVHKLEDVKIDDDDEKSIEEGSK
jgi:2-oxoglutarate ferredoxin oxidoreductase subunit delta